MSAEFIMEIVGGLAAFLTTVSFVPQVIKVWKTKRADDLSLMMFLMFWLGVLCWLIYGFYLGSISIIIGNIVTLILASTILYFKVWYGSRRIGNNVSHTN